MENWSIFEQISENGKFTPTPSNILTVGAVQCGSLVLCVTSRWWWSSDIIWCWWLRQTLMLAPGRLSLVSWRGAPNKILIISQIFSKNVISDNCLTVRMFVWGLCKSKQDYYQYWSVEDWLLTYSTSNTWKSPGRCSGNSLSLLLKRILTDILYTKRIRIVKDKLSFSTVWVSKNYFASGVIVGLVRNNMYNVIFSCQENLWKKEKNR